MKNYRMGFYEVKLFSSNIPLLVAVPFFFSSNFSWKCWQKMSRTRTCVNLAINGQTLDLNQAMTNITNRPSRWYSFLLVLGAGRVLGGTMIETTWERRCCRILFVAFICTFWWQLKWRHLGQTTVVVWVVTLVQKEWHCPTMWFVVI